MRVLVVEDDDLTAQALATVLTQQNYAVEVAADGETGWELVTSSPFDLILLDVMIPKLDGLELCRRLRSHSYQTPILLLTGLDSGHDKAIGLDAGADDYVVKPFDPEELVARIRALLRRGSGAAQPVLEWGHLGLDPSTCQVTYLDTPLALTPKEYALLELFLRNHRRVFSCSAILDHIWTFEDAPGEEAVRTHIKGLRHKLKAAGAPADLVETVYGIGYRLKPEEEPGTSNQRRKHGGQATQARSKQSGQEGENNAPIHPQPSKLKAQNSETLSAIAGVWQRFQPRICEQVGVLEQAVVALEHQRLAPSLHQQAVNEAHTLAGSLGTFGLPEGSQLAREIYHLLQRDRLEPVDIQNLRQRVTLLRQRIEGAPATEITTSTSAVLDPIPTASPSQQVHPMHAAITAKILAVDNDPQILAFLQTLLEPWGLKVTTLEDPRQFWSTLAATDPDLVILDLHMPYHSGFELCHAIREDDRWSPLPVMILTAHVNAETLNQVFAAGADDFVSKPIVGPELVTRIVNRLERVRLLRRLQGGEGTPDSRSAASTASVAVSPPAQEDPFFNLAPDLLCIAGLDGYFKRLNLGFEQTLGFSQDELLAVPFLNFVHPDDHAQTRQAMKQLAAGHPMIDFENRYRRRDGSYRWLAWRVIPVLKTQLLYAIARDVTERKRQEAVWQKSKNEIELRVAERTAELVSLTQRLRKELDAAKQLEAERNQATEALRLSQARFAGILEIADDAIISIDHRQTITLFNQGAEKIFGYRAEEVLGKSLDILLPISSIAAHRQHVKDFGSAPRQARRMGERRPIFGHRKDGTEFPAEASISRLDMGEEKVFTVILRDITERQKIDRMKDEFISVVSHELRTPLTSIHGSLGMLASGLISAESERGNRLLQIAVESTDRLVRLINDILDIERIESGKVTLLKEPWDMADLIDEAINSVQPIADQASVKLAASSCSVPVVVDRDRIVRALTNFLCNAIKFSNPAETVWLRAELSDQAARNDPQSAESPLSSQPDTLLVTIQDQGRGIPADKLDTIFERFQQVDASDSRNHDGTGLGLAICRSIIHQHGGQVWVESQLGQGSTFYFTLPLSRQEDTENSQVTA